MAIAVRRTLFIALTILARRKTIVQNQYITALQNVGKRFPIFIVTGEHLVVSGMVIYVALWHKARAQPRPIVGTESGG
jgi:hypothetical protein